MSELRPKSKKRQLSSLDQTNEEEKRQQIKRRKVMNVKVITLDVGGIKYVTSIQTLTGHESMLKARFSGNYADIPSDDGSFFFDRNGELFKYILEYLRTGHLMLPSDWNQNHIWRFYIEVKYFMVKSLFDNVLYRLLNSGIVRDVKSKSEIFEKIAQTMDKSKHLILENIKNCRLHYKYDINQQIDRSSKDFQLEIERVESGLKSIHHSLLLIQTKGEMRGMYLTSEGDDEYGYANYFHFLEENSVLILQKYPWSLIKHLKRLMLTMSFQLKNTRL